eukprot:253859-Chlamydomonas_euryale.AAC.3
MDSGTTKQPTSNLPNNSPTTYQLCCRAEAADAHGKPTNNQKPTNQLCCRAEAADARGEWTNQTTHQ